MRTLAIWCPEWPAVAATLDGTIRPSEAAAVFRANRVVAATAAARASGVRRAMRRREAQARCPELEVLAADEARDTRVFEAVVAVVSAFAPLVEIVRPGWCQLATRGPSRYFGGDAALADQLQRAIGELGVVARLGVADGSAAAALAARSDPDGAIVAPGGTAAHLASRGVRTLIGVGELAPCGTPSELDALVDLWARLGLAHLGAVAALAPIDIATRFGPLGAWAHGVASGAERRATRPRRPPSELLAAAECDPPLERVDTAAFVARGLAEQLVDALAADGAACTCIRIEADVEHPVTGERTSVVRRWRHERAGAVGGLTAATLADRVRWQLEGWLARAPASGGAIVALRLIPEEVVADRGRQLTLWGGPAASDERAARAFTRIQALLGPQAVRVPVPVGGRRPSDLVTLVPWGDARPGPRPGPWTGGIPAPHPSVVHDPPRRAALVDADGSMVTVSGRADLSSPPAVLELDGCRHPVEAWAGPWPLDERWWDPAQHRRQARFQVQTADAVHLVVLEAGQWWVEATYN